MMKLKTMLGRIDCPTCGTVKGLGFTPDKNGHPFGFCAECGQQVRIGPSTGRLAAFYRHNTHILRDAEPKDGAAPATASPAAPKAAPVITMPAELPKKKGTGNAMLDLINGVRA